MGGRWEYYVEREYLVDKNALGALGWELVSAIMHTDGYVHLYFKRAMPDNWVS